MWAKRFSLEYEQTVETRESVGAFVAVPVMVPGLAEAGAFQQQLYQWAYEHAKQAMQARRPATMRDLFAVMN